MRGVQCKINSLCFPLSLCTAQIYTGVYELMRTCMCMHNNIFSQGWLALGITTTLDKTASLEQKSCIMHAPLDCRAWLLVSYTVKRVQTNTEKERMRERLREVGAGQHERGKCNMKKSSGFVWITAWKDKVGDSTRGAQCVTNGGKQCEWSSDMRRGPDEDRRRLMKGELLR